MVGRWLLLLLVAFDILSSPFHAHSHDISGGGEIQWEHGGADIDHDDETHAEAHEHQFGHSLIALQPAEMPRLSKQTLLDWFVAPAAIKIHDAAVVDLVPSTATPDHIPIPDDILWRPIGRAPPTLHV